MRSLTIQIPQPCHERWDDMQPNERGRFCSSCQKTIVDYTNLSDKELIKLLSRSSGTSCGRFLNEQLNRPLVVANPGTSGWRHWVGLLTMGLLGWQTTRAQVSQAPKPQQSTSVRLDFSVSTIPPRMVTNSEKIWVIQGRVMLMDSNAKLSAVPKANVYISQSGRIWEALTDSTGSYSLEVITKNQVNPLGIKVYSPDNLYGSSTINLDSSATPITVETIVLYRPGTGTLQQVEISAGNICTVRPPSRWQKLKRKLFH